MRSLYSWSHHSRPGRHRYWPWLGLATSTWFLIAYHAWELVLVIRHAAEIQARTGPFAARFLAGPPVLLATLLLLWFRYFRDEREGARVFALTGAFLMLCATLVLLINQDLHDISYSAWLRRGLPLSALAWLLYAVLGRERGY